MDGLLVAKGLPSVAGADGPRRGVWGAGWRRAGSIGLALLLPAELLALTLRFDSWRLLRSGAWWSPLAGSSRYLPEAATALAGVLLVVGGPRLWSAVLGAAVGEGRRGRPAGRTAAYFLLQLAWYGVLVGLTAAVWEGPLGQSAATPAWLAVWLGVALATSAFWVAAVGVAGVWGALPKHPGVWAGALAVGASACYAGRLTGEFWEPMRAGTFLLVRGLLSLACRDVVAVPSEGLVGAGGFNIRVAPACSGYEGVGLIWVFLAAYLVACRRSLRFPTALWLLPMGTAAVWLVNAARIAALVLVGAWVSPAVALGGFHSQAGWLGFNAVALGLVALSRKLPAFASGPAVGPGLQARPSRPGPGDRATAGPATATGLLTATASESAVNPTAVYLGPLLALVAAMTVAAAVGRGDGFDPLYPARVAAVAAALWACRRHGGGLLPGLWRWSWPAAGAGLAVFALWSALEPADPAAGVALRSGLGGLPAPLAALWLVARVVGSAVTVPAAEELAFRGYLTRRLIAGDFTAVAPGAFRWPAFVLSSVLFGAFHGRWVAGVAAGAAYALVYYRKGRLSEAVLAHAVTNGLIAAAVLAGGRWWLWA